MRCNRLLLFLAALLVCPIASAAQAPRAAGLTEYDSRYYHLYTDLPPGEAREASIRMDAMVEEYARRTRGFSGSLRGRLPFYLFQHREDYIAAGGIPGSAGVFTGARLMAVAGNSVSPATWHVIQHEGFHQFARQVIGGGLPIWVNEGLADYFGEALYTGESFLDGAIPEFRLRRIQQSIQEGRFQPIQRMMRLTHRQWNQELAIANYDQAWSMVYFLVHADDGKYQKAFEQFILLAGRGQPPGQAWAQTFGDPVGFQQRWRDYWLKLPSDPTPRVYGRASIAIYTALLGRITLEGLPPPDSLQELLEAEQTLAARPDHVPFSPTLLATADNFSARRMRWSIDQDGPRPRIIAELSDGSRFTGEFTLRAKRIHAIRVELDDFAPLIQQARELANAGEKRQAATLLQQTLRRLPRSPFAEEARKLLQELR